MPDITIRNFTEKDVPQLLEMMKALARFENYIDDFAVTEHDLCARGLGPDPSFEALVAEENNFLVGMAVIYHIPWTYDLKPKLVLKELYVSTELRGRGVGKRLIEGVATRANDIGASQVNWTVLKGNSQAETFYRKLGGTPDPVWDGWMLDGAAISNLSK